VHLRRRGRVVVTGAVAATGRVAVAAVLAAVSAPSA